VAYVVIVSAVYSQQSQPIGIVAQYVAIVNVYTLQGLTLGVAVVAVRPNIHGVGHVGPQRAATHFYILTASPEAPPVVVEGYTVVAGAQEAVLYLHIPAAHQVDAITPRPGREALDIADGNMSALTTKDGLQCHAL